jgi:hypothetical protein
MSLVDTFIPLELSTESYMSAVNIGNAEFMIHDVKARAALSASLSSIDYISSVIENTPSPSEVLSDYLALSGG